MSAESPTQPVTTELPPALLLRMYRTMALIRRSDERLRRGMSSGEFGFSYWPVEGQEAMAAGAACALDPSDQLVTTYRGLADVVAKDIPLGTYFAELFGKSTGLSKGKAGAMGVSAPDRGIMWSTGIVGEGPPIANGLALASALRRDGKVVMVSFGDGATSIGFTHEAFNLAALWSLPVIFLCQNNGFAECTPMAGYTRTVRLADRAAGYGMAGVTVDGTDPVAVYGAVRKAADRARQGEGPTLVEAVAFRLQGHYFGDDMSYVDPDALAQARDRDPFTAFRKRLVGSGAASADEVATVDAEVAKTVEDAIVFAKDSPPTDIEELYIDVYKDRAEDGSVASATGSTVTELPAGSGPVEEMGLVQAVNRGLDRALERDPSIVLLGEDIADPAGGIFKVTSGLSTKHGVDRVRATPIAETSIIGAALGLSLAGFKPIPEIMFMDFVGVCLDQIANHAAKVRYMSGGRQAAPLTIRVAVGAGSGPQHSQSLEAWLMHVPGLKVVWPSTPADAIGLLNSCIDDDDPTVFIEAMSLFFGGGKGPVPAGDHYVPIGSAVVARPGSDLTVVAYGPMVKAALASADQLAQEGVSVEVVDLRTLVPLDLRTILTSVAKTKRLVVTHQSPAFCGPGAEIAAAVGTELFGELRAPIQRVAATHTPVPRSPELEAAALPGPDSISDTIRPLLK